MLGTTGKSVRLPTPGKSGAMAASLQTHRLARRIRSAAADDRAERATCERKLVELYKRDPSQRPYVIDAFRPFAASFALRLKRGEEPLDDLRQVAMVGLIK